MTTDTITAGNADNLSDLREAKQAWSARLLKPAPANVFRARAALSTAAPGQNVVGVGVGEKVTSGQPTGVLAVKFFVRVKYRDADVAKADRLPESIDGLPVDIEETGVFRSFALPNPKTKIRPAQPGSSIGFEIPGGQFVMAGTFGAVVKKGSQLFILSNNHVLADENQLPVGAAIFQPGLLDHGNAATDRIASLSAFIALNPAGNKVDAAIAKVDASALVKKDVLFIGPPKGTAKAAMDMSVHKFGRTTSYTVGKITSVDTDVTVGYETGDFTFASQIIIQGLAGASFSNAGDSGSLILQRVTNKAVGLLFAGSASHTIANHLSDVLKALKVKLA
jgi:hypothetical protein